MHRALPLCLLLAACGQGETAPTSWQTGPIVAGRNYSSGVTLNGLTASLAKGGEMDGLFRPVTSLGPTITVAYTVKGTFHEAEHPDRPGYVTLMFQRRGDDWLAAHGTENYRWYTRQAFALTDGAHEYTVPLTPDQWTNVLGQSDPKAFAEALGNVAAFHLAFGSNGAGREHGVISPDGGTVTITKIEGLN